MRAVIPLAVMASLLASPAWANGQSATASGVGRAEVVAPLVVTRESDLDFGSILAGTRPGTVTISPAGVASYGGGVDSACAGADCAAGHAARFAVHGESGRSYTIAVPDSVIAEGTALQAGDAAPPLTVGGLGVRSDSRPSEGAAGQLDASGSDGFQVGGTLVVPPGVPAARYRATVPVTVNYG